MEAEKHGGAGDLEWVRWNERVKEGKSKGRKSKANKELRLWVLAYDY